MRIAVISDIHGNRLALEAVLEDIAHIGADTVLNLGDRRGGADGSRSARSSSSERSSLPTVRGNHDRWIVERRQGPRRPLRRATCSREKDFAWLGALPATLVVNNEIFLCHGTPRATPIRGSTTGSTTAR